MITVSTTTHKTVSFIIPTIGRDSLQDTLASIHPWPGDEILVIQHHPPSGDWGSSERNEGLAKATGDYISFIDDDDIYAPDARYIMDRAIQESRRPYPILFRMRMPDGKILWDKPRLRCNRMGTPMIFVPNIYEKFVPWNGTIEADFQFINCQYWPHRHIIWREEIIALVNHADSPYEESKQ